MVRSTLLLAGLATVASVYAATTATTCSLTQHCPDTAPCCSQYGECGTGAYCLGGCDPLSSFGLDSCVPEPVCKDKTYTWKDMSGITAKTKYLGDSSKTDWVMDGNAVPYDDTLLLTMAPGTSGTVLATSTYMWYGTVKAKFKTSRGRGVVTAFILLSDIKDEIDYEYVGVDLETAQTNYYFQGVAKYDQGRNISLSDTYDNYHEYEIQWTPDTITWLVDGQKGRVKNRKDTWNATSNQWEFPQTPARVQISIWPGGLASNAKGTIDWAGGEIDWNSDDIKQNGYYYAQFESVSVECFNADSAPGTNKGKSYTYSDRRATNDTVVDGDKPTILKSLKGSGTDMDAGAPSGTAAAKSSGAAEVPGMSGGGHGGEGDQPADESASSTAESGAAATEASDGGEAKTGSGAGAAGFSQGTATKEGAAARSGGLGLVGSVAVAAGLGLVVVGML